MLDLGFKLDMTVFNSRKLMVTLIFTLADFEVKKLYGIGFEISKPHTSMGNISPKLEKIETFTNIFQWMTTIFNAISNATKLYKVKFKILGRQTKR